MTNETAQLLFPILCFLPVALFCSIGAFVYFNNPKIIPWNPKPISLSSKEKKPPQWAIQLERGFVGLLRLIIYGFLLLILALILSPFILGLLFAPPFFWGLFVFYILMCERQDNRRFTAYYYKKSD